MAVALFRHETGAALAPLGGSDRSRVALGALARFSPIALISVIALAATGTLQAIIEVGGISKLWDTGYGRMVVAKVLLLLVLIALGAANRQRLLPALEKAVKAGVEPGRIRAFLQRNVRVETALIGVVLGIVLGVALGGLLVARVDFIDFTLPVKSLIAFGILGVIVGIAAAIFPARRAARLNVLQALQYE